MKLLTTTIGAYPKPDYVQIPDWFRAPAGPDTHDPTQGWAQAVSEMGAEAEAVFARGVEEVVSELSESVTRARRAGVPEHCIAVDPGIGFGKRLPDNLALLANETNTSTTLH